MEKYDVVKDWEGIDFECALIILEAMKTHYPNAATEVQDVFLKIEMLRNKQLKTFPKLERK